MHIRCLGNPFTEQLPSDNPGIIDMFNGRYLEMRICLSAYCKATAVLVVHLEVSVQQRVFRPQ
jgi:hypothetical protein